MPLADRPILPMKRLAPTTRTVLALLQPETDFERYLLSLPEFREGMLWGEPRFGHPEGKVFYHVREVLDNIDRIANLSAPMRERLRIIAFVHDTFKYCEDKGVPRDWSRHHSVLARQFLQQHTSDEAVLDVVELHDEAYYAWRAARSETTPEKGQAILDALLARLGSNLQLFYLFFKCDTQTGDKTQASWKWFERVVKTIEITQVKD